MDCLCCSESLGTRLDCCPDKLICTRCRNEKMEIKCPDCGTSGLPSESNFLLGYLSGKFQKLLSQIQKIEISYNQVIEAQKEYLRNNSGLLSKYTKSQAIIKVNLKPVELALETNESLRAQLESMRKVLELNPSLSLFEAYLKIKSRLKDWSIPMEVDLHPIRVRETSVLSDDKWLTFVLPRDLISGYLRIQKKEPIRTLEFQEPDEISQITSKGSYSVREVGVGYYYIGSRFPNRMILWDPQSGKTIFSYTGEYYSCRWNGRWLALLIKGYIWFKKIETLDNQNPKKPRICSEFTELDREEYFTKINLQGVEDNQWDIFQDFVMVNIAGNLMRISLNSPNSFFPMDTEVKEVMTGCISRKFHDGLTILTSYNTPKGEKQWSATVPAQKIIRTSELSMLLFITQQIWIDGDLLDVPPELATVVQNYRPITSNGELLSVTKVDKTYIFRFH